MAVARSMPPEDAQSSPNRLMEPGAYATEALEPTASKTSFTTAGAAGMGETSPEIGLIVLVCSVRVQRLCSKVNNSVDNTRLGGQ